MTGKTMQRIALTDGDYALARWENPGAPPVLLVHGITGTHMAWPLLVESLARDYDIYAPDLRGRGGSGELPGPYGLASHVRDLLALLDAFGLERVNYVGHSLGAYIGLEFAAAAAERLERLVLVDGGIALPAPPDLEPAAVVEALLGPAIRRLDMRFPDLASYLAFWRQHPAFAEVADWSRLLEPFVAYDLLGEGPEMRSSVNPVAVREDAAGPLAAEMHRRIDEAAVPMLLLTAPRGLQNQPEPMMPLAAVQAKVAANERLVHVEIPDCNHYTIVMDERPARDCAARIDAFLAA